MITLIIAVLALVALASLVGVIVIVTKKFPQLRMIDVLSIPKERDRERKQMILEERAIRNFKSWWLNLGRKIMPSLRIIKNYFFKVYDYARAVEKKYQKRLMMSPSEREVKVNEALLKAVSLMSEGNVVQAENILIDALSLESKNPSIYRLLGNLYMKKKSYDEARDLFAFLVKLQLKSLTLLTDKRTKQSPDVDQIDLFQVEAVLKDDLIHDSISLGDALTALGIFDGASIAYRRAVAYEPLNPKYLDLLLESCILQDDKVGARAVFSQLQEVNPDNQKLSEFNERIESIK